MAAKVQTYTTITHKVKEGTIYIFRVLLGIASFYRNNILFVIIIALV